MNSYKDDFVFLLGLISGAVVGGALAAFMLPRGMASDLPVVVRGLPLINPTDDAITRAQQVADATLAQVQSSARDIIDNAAAGTDASSAV